MKRTFKRTERILFVDPVEKRAKSAQRAEVIRLRLKAIQEDEDETETIRIKTRRR